MDPIKKVESLIEKGESFLGRNFTSSNPEFQAWNNSLIRFVEQQYGKESTTRLTLKKRHYSLGIYTMETSEEEFVEAFERCLKITLEDLKYILEELKESPEPKYISRNIEQTKNDGTSIIINNNNSNSNNINFNMSIDDIKRVIEDNTMLSDSDKKELTKQLDTIEDLQKSKKSKNEKWKVAKVILKFVVDKGADIAIMFLPQILKVLQG